MTEQTTDIATRDETTVATRYEPDGLKGLMEYAKYIVKSSLVPDHIENPADVVMIVQRGGELGLTAMTALQNMYVVNSKVSLPAAVAVGVVKATPVCEYFTCIEAGDEKSTWETKRRGNPEPTRYTFSKEDAQTAGLWGDGTWKKYPRNMLAARASMNLARMEYQDVLAGVYTPDELGAETDADGIPTQSPPTTVEAEVTDVTDVDEEESGDVPAEAKNDAWDTYNRYIHKKLEDLDEMEMQAFHSAIKVSFDLEPTDDWIDLSAKQLAMIRKRIMEKDDPTAWAVMLADDYLNEETTDE